jgi:GMP synthase (glutamine-hydrolysing)
MPPGNVLVVQHEPETPAGWVGEGLLAAGVRLTTCRPYAGDAVPGDLHGWDGLVVLGGAMDSWDDAATPWLPATRELVRSAERGSVPALGICLGHQIAAAALGGTVGRNPTGTTLAVLPVAWTPPAADDALFGGLPQSLTVAVHWNNDVVLEPPPGAAVTARSPDGAVQAARLGRSVWGVQFHPEAGSAIVGGWLAGEGTALVAQGVDCDGYLDDIRRHEPSLEEGGRRLAAAFASLLDGTHR